MQLIYFLRDQKTNPVKALLRAFGRRIRGHVIGNVQPGETGHGRNLEFHAPVSALWRNSWQKIIIIYY
jgi:hypothetical protein